MFGLVKQITPEQVEELKAIGVRQDAGARGRCGSCGKMTDLPMFWVEDGARIGDPVWAISDLHKRHAYNGHGTAWCGPCAVKLLDNKEPRQGPPPPPPAPFKMPEFDKVGEDELMQMFAQKGGGVVQYLPTETGSELLSQYGKYHSLAVAGHSSYNAQEIALKVIGLILLDGTSAK